MKQVYLDYQSAKPVDPRVVEGMTKYFHEAFGNPSALHQVGDVATDALEESRKTIAKFINADEDEIVFTAEPQKLLTWVSLVMPSGTKTRVITSLFLR
jgi:cysteine sulfinate desulfinase/cysteine desulfurase-like protein